mmetsp:Transcript_5632/g.9307  ORF Transcript_5632/g.9307 Transcript_5632/m.9307 type:complete len:217 (-) Transcript_5632:2326-2976(-)
MGLVVDQSPRSGVPKYGGLYQRNRQHYHLPGSARHLRADLHRQGAVVVGDLHDTRCRAVVGHPLQVHHARHPPRRKNLLSQVRREKIPPRRNRRLGARHAHSTAVGPTYGRPPLDFIRASDVPAADPEGTQAPDRPHRRQFDDRRRRAFHVARLAAGCALRHVAHLCALVLLPALPDRPVESRGLLAQSVRSREPSPAPGRSMVRLAALGAIRARL